MPTTKGIMGFVKLTGAGALGKIRVTSLGLRASQEISAMETIDSVYDYTAYRLGPVRVEGDIAFPIPVLSNQWNAIITAGAERNNTTGQMANKTIMVEANYDHNIKYKYENCSVNTMAVSVNSEEAVEVTMNLLGTKRSTAGRQTIASTSPERVLTWNEVTVTTGGSMAGSSTSRVPEIPSSQVRNFSFEVNNNNTVFFGLGGEIVAVVNNIVAGKREVTGSMEIAWNQDGLGLQDFDYNVNAENGPDYCSSNLWINMAIDSNCSSSSSPKPLKFHGVMYNMEEISMTNDFFMGTQTWKAYGEEGNSYRAMSLDGTSI